jgi:hypothetical protein
LTTLIDALFSAPLSDESLPYSTTSEVSLSARNHTTAPSGVTSPTQQGSEKPVPWSDSAAAAVDGESHGGRATAAAVTPAKFKNSRLVSLLFCFNADSLHRFADKDREL